MITRRSFFAAATGAVVAASASKFIVVEANAQAESSKYQSAFSAIDDFVERYMREMNAPGMTLVIADAGGVIRVATYGFSDREESIRVAPDHLFHIGSISKSFTALALLQLADEGKLDLQRPILGFLPWLKIENRFAPITVHHLLTHSSGLPGNVPIFLSDPNAAHRVGFPPGKHFHYCNLGYDILGHLLAHLDGRTYGEAIRARILQPLAMANTEATINSDIRERTAKSYMAYHDERPFPRLGRLAEAPQLIFEKGSGSIASTPADMGRYIRMIANKGQADRGALIQPRTFAKFVEPHIKAEDFGPTASYGYGLAIDTLDGHRIVRHTGGMVSFMSSMQIDLDEGVGIFASINAMQGYRPNPVAAYALRAMRAVREGKPMPPVPAASSHTIIPNATDYEGVFNSPDGAGELQLSNEGDFVFLRRAGKPVQLETTTGAGLLAEVPGLDKQVFVFSRKDGDKGPISEIAHGSDWWVGPDYTGPRKFDVPKEWNAYVGHYRNDSPWFGSFRVFLRKGKLWLDGVVALEPMPNKPATFRLTDPPYSPEWIRFLAVVNGKARQVKFSGEDFRRVDAV